ncbi:hypothetical protein [Halobacillus mangrovi]|uniref:Uncharacterized protein n=1 Tax=Halobacillus mangrovi TaxID=402384 RepID=A0A1W5ZVS6_9BACI|nr:hypothetical protein [Halobacillus mangrovi]ARI77383.1 hypothetical protein HM131_11255 [Halobacillus mangrovi]
MNDQEKEKFDQLLSSLRKAKSMEETRFYFDLIQDYLNTLQIEKGSVYKRMNAEELMQFEILKQQMLAASDKKEVTYFEKQIHDLITRVNLSKT